MSFSSTCESCIMNTAWSICHVCYVHTRVCASCGSERRTVLNDKSPICNLTSKLVPNLVLSTSCLPNWCKKKKKREIPKFLFGSDIKKCQSFFSCLISLSLSFLFSLRHRLCSGLVLCRPIQSLWCSSSMHAIFVGTVAP